MAVTFVGNNSQAVTGATECDLNNPAAAAAGDIIVSVFAFENVAAGSGPWIVPNIGQFTTQYIGPSTGWEQVCWQSPSAAGVGIEVWSAQLFSGTQQFAKFAASQNCQAVNAAYRGALLAGNPVTNGGMRLAVAQAVTGGQPPAPSVVANAGELIVACGGDLMGGGGFGSPSGFTNRVDASRAGAGTVEATIADATPTVAGTTGPIVFPGAAAAGTTRGATATLAIRPAPVTAGSGGVMDAPLPEDLDIGPGYTIRVVGVDPVTGNQVPGVKVGAVVITASAVGGVGGGGNEPGQWFLVPGEGA